MKDFTVIKLVIWIVVVFSFLGSIWLTSEFLGGNSAPLYLYIGLGVVLLFIFGLRERCWLSLPFALGLQGNINFLPVRFSFLELATLACLGSTTVFYIMGDRKKGSAGNLLHRIPILVISSVALFHWVKGGSIGLRTFGSSSIGSRPIFTILVAAISFFLILYLASYDSRSLRFVPWLYLGGASIEFSTQGLTYFFPSLAPTVFRFYSNVNLDAYAFYMGSDNQGEIVRFGAINQLVLALALALISQFPPSTWLIPSRMFIPFVLMGCFLGSILGGFRSGLATLAVHVFTALFATTRALVLVFGLSTVLLCFVLAQMHGSLFDLPLSMQRTLSMFPGKWDSRVIASASGSNDFRTKIIELYLQEYALNNMFFGTGWSVRKESVAAAENAFLRKSISTDPDSEAREFIELRNEHWGWINAHHTTGLFGLFSLAILTLGSSIWMLLKFLRLPKSAITPPMTWSFAIIIYQSIVFLFMGQPIRDCFPTICVVLAIATVSMKVGHPTTLPR